jgi:hypothetical protein
MTFSSPTYLSALPSQLTKARRSIKIAENSTMRILCLHGVGTNSQVFETQLGEYHRRLRFTTYGGF